MPPLDSTTGETTTDETGEWYRTLVETSPVMIAIQAGGRCRYANRALLAAVGASAASEVVGRPLWELVPAVDRDVTRERIERVTRDRVAAPLREVTLVRLDGGSIDVEVMTVPVTYHGANAAQVIALDLTERRQAKAALQGSRDLFATAFRASSNAVIIFRARDELVLDVNDAWCDTTGYTRDEVIGQVRPAWGLWADTAERERLRETLRRGDRVHELELSFRRRNDPLLRHAILSADPVEITGHPCVLVILREVTGQRQLEAQLRQAQKMEAVGQLAGGIAHDFNNLLTVIKSSAELALLAGSLPAEGRADVEGIVHAADRAAALTRQLLAFSRRQVLQPAALDVNEIVRVLDGMLLRLLGAAITRRIELDPGGAPVIADRSQLEQVIMNLVLNARDAMPIGGTLTITTRAVTLSPDECREWHTGDPVPPGTYVQLTVADTGQGMTDETRLRIFEPFFTTKEQGKGTGLGLSMVYGIVKQSGGYVWADSEPGEGTTFCVYLPAAPNAAPHPAAPAAPPAGSGARADAVARGTTVLLVEDEESVRRAAARMLSRAGYDVLSVENGRAALALLADRSVDIVLSDMSMPEMGGAQLARELRAIRPSLPVVFMSGHPAATYANVAGGAAPVFVQKPFSSDELLQALRTVLLRRSP